MRQSLLGMRLLARLSSIEISDDKLTIQHYPAESHGRRYPAGWTMR